MPAYKCTNNLCSLYNQEVSRDTQLKFNPKGKVDTGSICPVCSLPCISINPEGYTTTIHGGPNICKK